MRWTEDQLADHLGRTGIPGASQRVDVSNPPFKPDSQTARFALGRLKTGEMNKTETAYDTHLWAQRHTGEIQWHKFESVKLRLADNTFYTADFFVLAADGVLEVHEVKGFWEDDARVKIKVAASLYPFRFLAFTPKPKKDGGGWKQEAF